MKISINRKDLISCKGQVKLSLAADNLNLNPETKHNLDIILGKIISEKYIYLAGENDENVD